MAWKLFRGALVIMLVKLNLADQQSGVNVPFSDKLGYNYGIPPATNQQHEQLGAVPPMQSGFGKTYNTKNSVLPLAVQDPMQPDFQNSKLPYSEGDFRQPTSDQFSGQKDLSPPVPPSSNAFYNQGYAKLPGNNGLPGSEVPPDLRVLSNQDSALPPKVNELPGSVNFPPPLQQGSNALPGQNALLVPGSDQLPTVEDVPPPVRMKSNELYGKGVLPVPRGSQFPGQGDFPPPLPQGSNPFNDQNTLPAPGSNQLPTVEDVPPPVQMKSNELYGKGVLPVPRGSQFPGQGDFPPPLPQGSNPFNDQNTLPAPGSNQLPTVEDVPPPVQMKSNELYGKGVLPVPRGSQFPGQGDFPPPLPQGSNPFSGQNTLPVPGSNQLPTVNDVPPPYGQNALPVPGSNQMPGSGDLPPPIPQSSNTFYGQGNPPPLGSNQLDGAKFPQGGGNLLSPVLPNFNGQNALNQPESNQIYGIDADPGIKIPYGNDVVVPPPDNNRLGSEGWQPPVRQEVKIPYGEDALVPPSSSEDKVPDVSSSVGNGLESSTKVMIDGTSKDIDQNPDSRDGDSFSYEEESKDLYDSYYYSALKGMMGLESVDDGTYSENESEGNNFLSIGNWDPGSDYNSFDTPDQGTAWRPFSTGNEEQAETGNTYQPKTRLRPVGSSSRADNTPLNTTASLYLIPIVLLVILIFLIRSNSYFRRSPKIVVVDPESRNRDIDAKAKEIEPLLRESMEYKDEVN